MGSAGECPVSKANPRRPDDTFLIVSVPKNSQEINFSKIERLKIAGS
jgi:hypothetical protein